jgi:hypothetical protein
MENNDFKLRMQKLAGIKPVVINEGIFSDKWNKLRGVINVPVIGKQVPVSTYEPVPGPEKLRSISKPSPSTEPASETETQPVDITDPLVQSQKPINKFDKGFRAGVRQGSEGGYGRPDTSIYSLEKYKNDPKKWLSKKEEQLKALKYKKEVMPPEKWSKIDQEDLVRLQDDVGKASEKERLRRITQNDLYKKANIEVPYPELEKKPDLEHETEQERSDRLHAEHEQELVDQAAIENDARAEEFHQQDVSYSSDKPTTTSKSIPAKPSSIATTTPSEPVDTKKRIRDLEKEKQGVHTWNLEKNDELQKLHHQEKLDALKRNKKRLELNKQAQERYEKSGGKIPWVNPYHEKKLEKVKAEPGEEFESEDTPDETKRRMDLRKSLGKFNKPSNPEDVSEGTIWGDPQSPENAKYMNGKRWTTKIYEEDNDMNNENELTEPFARMRVLSGIESIAPKTTTGKLHGAMGFDKNTPIPAALIAKTLQQLETKSKEGDGLNSSEKQLYELCNASKSVKGIDEMGLTSEIQYDETKKQFVNEADEPPYRTSQNIPPEKSLAIFKQDIEDMKDPVKRAEFIKQEKEKLDRIHGIDIPDDQKTATQRAIEKSRQARELADKDNAERNKRDYDSVKSWLKTIPDPTPDAPSKPEWMEKRKTEIKPHEGESVEAYAERRKKEADMPIPHMPAKQTERHPMVTRALAALEKAKQGKINESENDTPSQAKLRSLIAKFLGGEKPKAKLPVSPVPSTSKDKLIQLQPHHDTDTDTAGKDDAERMANILKKSRQNKEVGIDPEPDKNSEYGSKEILGEKSKLDINELKNFIEELKVNRIEVEEGTHGRNAQLAGAIQGFDDGSDFDDLNEAGGEEARRKRKDLLAKQIATHEQEKLAAEYAADKAKYPNETFEERSARKRKELGIIPPFPTSTPKFSHGKLSPVEKADAERYNKLSDEKREKERSEVLKKHKDDPSKIRQWVKGKSMGSTHKDIIDRAKPPTGRPKTQDDFDAPQGYDYTNPNWSVDENIEDEETLDEAIDSLIEEIENPEDVVYPMSAVNISEEDDKEMTSDDFQQYMDQLKKGVETEKEHTKTLEIPMAIAMDHLAEIPDYYSRLSKMEKNAKKSVNENDDEEDLSKKSRKKSNNSKEDWNARVEDYLTIEPYKIHAPPKKDDYTGEPVDEAKAGGVSRLTKNIQKQIDTAKQASNTEKTIRNPFTGKIEIADPISKDSMKVRNPSTGEVMYKTKIPISSTSNDKPMMKIQNQLSQEPPDQIDERADDSDDNDIDFQNPELLQRVKDSLKLGEPYDQDKVYGLFVHHNRQLKSEKNNNVDEGVLSRKCGWCQKAIGDDKDSEGTESGVSHGICPDCHSGLMKQIETEKDKDVDSDDTQNVDEMSMTGGVSGFSTPMAFKPNINLLKAKQQQKKEGNVAKFLTENIHNVSFPNQ